jgi:hypothetical protein
MAGTAPHHPFPARPLLTQVAVVAVFTFPAELLERAVQAAEVMQVQPQAVTETPALQIQVVVVAVHREQVGRLLTQVAPAAPASSFFATQSLFRP